MVFDSNLRATEAESACLASLRDAIKDMDIPTPSSGPPIDHESILLRFARGYGLNVKDAAKAFAEMLSYRSTNNIDAAREAMYAAAKSSDEIGRLAAAAALAPHLKMQPHAAGWDEDGRLPLLAAERFAPRVAQGKQQ